MIGPSSSQHDVSRARDLLRSGRAVEAVGAFTKLLKRQPNHPDLLHGLALAKAQTGDHAGAIRSMERAVKARPGAASLRVDLGQMLVGGERYEEAERAFDRALGIEPGHVGALAAKAELHLLVGAYDRASADIEEGLGRAPNDLRLALALGKLAPRLGAEGRAAALLERHLSGRMPSAFAEMAVCFRLADQYDRLGEFGRAFELYQRANGLFPGRFEPSLHARAVGRMVGAWTRERVAGLPESGLRDELPVFIVGMPRSGTSLVEQILACHPGVHGAGELQIVPATAGALAPARGMHEAMIDDPDVLTRQGLERHGRLQIAALRKLGGKADRVTDKLPVNFLHVGLISRLHPRARVIHCTRDPLDTCLSCYFQWFRSGLPWAYRPEWLGAYYREYVGLMDHWTRVLGDDVPILEVPYEELVGDQEAWSRRIVGFAGLEWDDACLRFYESKRVTATLSNEQVRRPIYRSSIGRHRHYEAHLEPFRRALGLE